MELTPLINLFILVISLMILDQASHLTITNAVKVSDITRLGKTTLGFLIIAFSTSLPELSVSVNSALTGEMGISIGNILGSNVVNICLIIGLGAILFAVKHKSTVNIIPSIAKEELKNLYFGLFIASIVPLSLIYLGYASQIIGLILLVVFAIPTYQLSKLRVPREEKGEVISEKERRKLRRYTALTFAGVTGVVLSSYFLVDSASNLAEFIGVPKILISATLIAFGTSLPELATSLKAITQGQSALALGNIVGSCFMNITLILGGALLVSPLRVDMVVFSDLVIFSLMSNLFLWYFLTSDKIGWKEGAILLFMYLLFLATTFGAVQLRPPT